MGITLQLQLISGMHAATVYGLKNILTIIKITNVT